jgi:hypothetical protein
MWIRARSLIVSTACVAVLGSEAVVYGQATTSPGRPSSDATGAIGKRSAEITVAQPATPAQPAPVDFRHQEELTGDWGGVRTRWRDKGFVFERSLTQFYQGVSSGGTETSSEYMGTMQATVTLDLGKLTGWEHWSAEIKNEARFGGPLITSTGTISPVNTSAIIPGADGTVYSVSAVNFTRLFPVNLKEGKLFAFSFGRYNLIDLLDEDSLPASEPIDS